MSDYYNGMKEGGVLVYSEKSGDWEERRVALVGLAALDRTLLKLGHYILLGEGGDRRATLFDGCDLGEFMMGDRGAFCRAVLVERFDQVGGDPLGVHLFDMAAFQDVNRFSFFEQGDEGGRRGDWLEVLAGAFYGLVIHPREHGYALVGNGGVL